MNGRAASWITTTSHASSIDSSPFRTESCLRRPPMTTFNILLKW